MKNKKAIIATIIIILVIGVIGAGIVITQKQSEEKAKQALIEFIGLINDKNYEAMYEKVVSMNMSKEDFINRNKNIYEGIDSSDIKIEIQKIEKQEGNYQIDYHEKMYTAGGEVDFSNTVIIEK